MRDIYLIDFENVASEGLSGITYLSEEDQVIIFYSNNSNRLSMKMHILIGKSVCQLSYFEVTVGGKNALDHQISTWLGYLIGTGAAQRNYYIVSRDMGYKHVANFWAANKIANRVRCVDAIKSASRLERNRPHTQEKNPAEPSVQEAPLPAETPTEISVALPQPLPAQEVQPDKPATDAPSVSVAVEEAPVSTEPAVVPLDDSGSEEAPLPITVEVSASPESENSPETAETVDAALPEDTVTAEAGETVEAAETEEPVPEAVASPAGEQKRSYRNRTRRPRKPRDNSALDSAPAEGTKPEIEKKSPDTKNQRKQTSKPKPRPQSAPVIPEELTTIIAPYPKLQENVLRELIANNKRQVLCNTLRKHLGQEKGLALYNEIKRAAWH